MLDALPEKPSDPVCNQTPDPASQTQHLIYKQSRVKPSKDSFRTDFGGKAKAGLSLFINKDYFHNL